MPTQLDIVPVRGPAILEDEDQLVLAPVQGAHPGIVLDPHTQILELGIDLQSGSQQLMLVSPIHAHVMQRPGGTVLNQQFQGGRQEPDELRLGHLPRGHQELAMAHPPFARDVTENGHVVGRVGEDQIRDSTLHQPAVGGSIESVTAKESMPAQLPQIARPTDRRSVDGYGKNIGGIRATTRRRREPFDPQIDFAHGEARGFEIEIELDRGEIAQNLAQELIVPARGLRKPIVGNAEGARLLCGQVLKADNGNVAQAQPPCRMDTAVAGEDFALPIGQDRHIEPKSFDAAGDLLDLPVCMEPRIVGIKLELLDRDPVDPKLVGSMPLGSCAPHPTPPAGRPTEIVSSTRAPRSIRCDPLMVRCVFIAQPAVCRRGTPRQQLSLFVVCRSGNLDSGGQHVVSGFASRVSAHPV